MMSGRSSDRVADLVDNVAGRGPNANELSAGRLASAARRRAPTYLTASRLAGIEARLTAQDWAVLETVHGFGFVAGPQLAQAHFGDTDNDARAARRALARMREDQLLDVLERRIGGVRAGSSGLVYRLGQAGLRLMTGGRRMIGEPGLHHLRHTLAIVDVLVGLKVAERSGMVELLRFDSEPDCWRPFTGKYGEPVTLKPDAYCEIRIGAVRKLWFVEVDRGTVSTTTLKKKLARYGEYMNTGLEQEHGHGVFPRVVWVAQVERRREHLRQLCAAENHRLGGELHRLVEDEWQPPPSSP